MCVWVWVCVFICLAGVSCHKKTLYQTHASFISFTLFTMTSNSAKIERKYTFKHIHTHLRSDTRTQTHVHTHTLSLSLSISINPVRRTRNTPSLAHKYTCKHTHNNTHTHVLSHTHLYHTHYHRHHHTHIF